MLFCTSQTWTEEITDQSKQACSFCCPPHRRNQLFQTLLHPQKAHTYHKLEEIIDSVKTSLQLLLSSTPKKPCLFKTCFAHKRPIFLRRATEIKMKTLNQGGCFKRLRWFYFQSRILLASAMVSGTWCTECCQVPQLALWLPADTLTSFLGWCEHAASVHDGKAVSYTHLTLPTNHRV